MIHLLAKSALLVALLLPAAGAVAAESLEVASTDSRWQPNEAHLTLGEALRIADAAFAKRVPSLVGHLQAAEFYYRCEVKEKCSWSFIYVGKMSLTVIVTVNDRTQQTDIWPPPLSGNK